MMSSNKLPAVFWSGCPCDPPVFAFFVLIGKRMIRIEIDLELNLLGHGGVA